MASIQPGPNLRKGTFYEGENCGGLHLQHPRPLPRRLPRHLPHSRKNPPRSRQSRGRVRRNHPRELARRGTLWVRRRRPLRNLPPHLLPFRPPTRRPPRSANRFTPRHPPLHAQPKSPQLPHFASQRPPPRPLLWGSLANCARPRGYARLPAPPPELATRPAEGHLSASSAFCMPLNLPAPPQLRHPHSTQRSPRLSPRLRACASKSLSPASDTIRSTPLIDTVPDILARIVAKKREDLARAVQPLEAWEREAEIFALFGDN